MCVSVLRGIRCVCVCVVLGVRHACYKVLDVCLF